MADASDLLIAALLKSQDDYKTDPLYLLGAKSIASPPIGNEYRMSPMERLAAGFATGLGGGLMQSIAKSQSSDGDMLKLAQALSGTDAERDAALVNDPAMAKYRPLAELLKSEQKQKDKDALTKLKDSMLEKGVVLNDDGTQSLAPGYDKILQQEEMIKAKASPLNALNSDEAANTLATLAAPLMGMDKPTPAVVDTYKNPRTMSAANTLLSIKGTDERGSRVSEKSALQIAEPVAIAEDVQKGIDSLSAALGSDPTLADKAWSQLPLGSDAYNAFKRLQISGARAAKALEGRVNDTTLGLYTDLLSSLNTEPLSASVKRAQAFIDSLKSDALTQADLLKGTGRDTTDIYNRINSLRGTASAGAGSISKQDAIAELRRRGVIK